MNPEFKLLDILRSTLGNTFYFKSFDEFLRDLIKTTPSNKPLTLDNQKQIKNQICDLFSQIKGKRISASPKEISKILFFLNKKLSALDFTHNFEYDFALDVPKRPILKFKNRIDNIFRTRKLSR